MPGGRCALVISAALAGCGAPPSVGASPGPLPPSAPAATARADPCASELPADASLAFQGLLRGARCRAEVLEIMSETARALGVGCDYCHEQGDFARSTPKKEVANWMAVKLASSLRRRGGGAVTCADCHAITSGAQGVAKILGSPRRQDRSVEWMTSVLVERFETAGGDPLYCRNCHIGTLGTPDFIGQVILTDHLPARGSHAPGSDD